MNLLKKVFLTVEGYDLVRKDETVLCAVSGGPDSVAMLHLLREVNEIQQLGWKVHAGHVHHGLRGKAADEDQEFVRNLCGKLQVPFHTVKVDAAGLKERERLSTEEAARDLRYEWLKKTSYELKAQKIAVAHNLDDQAETILHRIIRGTGLRGLKGMPPIRLLSKKHDLFLVRPLIEVERYEIESYLRERSIPYRTDLTNFDTSITRNKLRHKLFPMIESEFNPRVKMSLVKLGQTAGSFYILLREIANEVYENTKMLSGENEVCLSVEEFAKLPPAIQTLIIDKALQSLLGRLPNLNFEHYLEIISLCGEQGYAKAVRLPKGLEARRESYVLKIYRPTTPPPPPKFTKKRLKIPGTTAIPRLNLQIEAEVLEGKIVGLKEYIRNKDYTEEVIDLEKVKGPLVLRLRRNGDIFSPLGARGKVKLKKFFIDNKVPKPVRDRVPILTDEDKIIWVVGYRIGDDVKITDNTLRALKLKVSRMEEEGS
ncbi:MAG: tRNA lysidine(34) synthetase TilS [Planctomycetes bacterium]|nr:tRNA lysidine(34) synthetase TilS [Planctomycetota bacterium]